MEKIMMGPLKRHTLISSISHWRLNKKRRKTMACPNCNGNNIELIHQINIEKDDCKIEEYFCHDCDCEWDWTFQRQFFHWPGKIRAPKWVKID
jgi:hypothetical protein